MFVDGICEYCKEPFRLATINCKEDGMPLCCDPAQDEWLANNATESQDGDKYCVLVGENLQEGTAGFGDERKDAINNLIDNLIDIKDFLATKERAKSEAQEVLDVIEQPKE